MGQSIYVNVPFLMFSEDIEMKHWLEMILKNLKLNKKETKPQKQLKVCKNMISLTLSINSSL